LHCESKEPLLELQAPHQIETDLRTWVLSLAEYIIIMTLLSKFTKLLAAARAGDLAAQSVASKGGIPFLVYGRYTLSFSVSKDILMFQFVHSMIYR